MADLIAIGYPDEATADAAAEEARRLAQDLIIQPDAIAVIVRDKDGSYHVHTSTGMAGDTTQPSEREGARHDGLSSEGLGGTVILRHLRHLAVTSGQQRHTRALVTVVKFPARRDSSGSTAPPLRHASPDVPPMFAVSAHEQGGAHASGQPSERAWSSPSRLL
jgi:hypothetical protein